MRTLGRISATFVWIGPRSAPPSLRPIHSGANRYNSDRRTSPIAAALRSSSATRCSCADDDRGGIPVRTWTPVRLRSSPVTTSRRAYASGRPFYDSDAYPDGSKDCSKLLPRSDGAPARRLRERLRAAPRCSGCSSEGAVLWARLRPSHGAIPSLGRDRCRPGRQRLHRRTSAPAGRRLGCEVRRRRHRSSMSGLPPAAAAASTKPWRWSSTAGGFVYLVGGTGLTGSAHRIERPRSSDPAGPLRLGAHLWRTGELHLSTGSSPCALASNWLVAAGTRNHA